MNTAFIKIIIIVTSVAACNLTYATGSAKETTHVVTKTTPSGQKKIITTTIKSQTTSKGIDVQETNIKTQVAGDPTKESTMHSVHAIIGPNASSHLKKAALRVGAAFGKS